jgi:hypothetical protein
MGVCHLDSSLCDDNSGSSELQVSMPYPETAIPTLPVLFLLPKTTYIFEYHSMTLDFDPDSTDTPTSDKRVSVGTTHWRKR